MSEWIVVGSERQKAMERNAAVNAYAKWTGKTKVEVEAMSTDMYMPSWQRWIEIFIFPQDGVTLQIMRDAYTTSSSKPWEDAKMSDVENVLGYCKSLTFPVQQVRLGGGAMCESPLSQYLKNGCLA